MGSKWILMLGIVLGVVAAALTYVKVGEEDEVVDLTGQKFMKLSSENNLAAGDRLTPELVSSVTVPLEFGEVKTVAVPYTSEMTAWLTNNDVRVNRDIAAGSFILHEHLLDDPEERFANIISEKGRAISIPVSENTSVAYFVEPGSRVDILSTFKYQTAPKISQPVNANIASPTSNTAMLEGLNNGFGSLKERVVTRTIMQNMLVLAVGQATTRNAYLDKGRSYGSITLDVTPEEAEMLTFLMSENQSKSGFNLVLRNPVNTDEQEIDAVDWDTITSHQ